LLVLSSVEHQQQVQQVLLSACCRHLHKFPAAGRVCLGSSSTACGPSTAGSGRWPTAGAGRARFGMKSRGRSGTDWKLKK
jgi:hypothetical protein